MGVLCIVAACSQFRKHNRKHSRVSNIRKRKCWVKSWLDEKYKSLYYGLVSELLFHGKEEFRMFLRINTEKYELVVSLCLSAGAQLGGGEREASPPLNLAEKFFT